MSSGPEALLQILNYQDDVFTNWGKSLVSRVIVPQEKYKMGGVKTVNAKVRNAQETRKTNEKASEKVIAYFD